MFGVGRVGRHVEACLAACMSAKTKVSECDGGARCRVHDNEVARGTQSNLWNRVEEANVPSNVVGLADRSHPPSHHRSTHR